MLEPGEGGERVQGCDGGLWTVLWEDFSGSRDVGYVGGAGEAAE